MGINEKTNKNPTNLINYAEKSILPPRLLVKMFILITFTENNMEVSFTMKKSMYALTVSILGLYPKEIKATIYKNVCSWM